MDKNRRKFLKTTGHTVLGLGLTGIVSIPVFGHNFKLKSGRKNSIESSRSVKKDLFFSISLAQWSLNRQFFSGKLDNLEFASIAKNKFNIDAIEYVNQFFPDKATDMGYLKEMKKRADDNGVRSVLIMIDREGGLAELNDEKRNKAVQNHHKWVDAAKFLGCHSIRVNAYSSTGTAEEVKKSAVEGLGKLTEYGAQQEIGVIVENHGGYSSDGEWLASVISQVGSKYCGTLPDLGNFCIERGEDDQGNRVCLKEYDKYKGTKELMPFAKGVSAKTHGFDENGNESNIDYMKMLKIVREANFKGYIGIEYEGGGDPYEGIQKTKDLLIKVGKKLS